MRSPAETKDSFKSGSLASLRPWRLTLAGLVMAVGVGLFAPGQSLAEGRGEDDRLYLFLDTKGLLEAEPGSDAAETSEASPEDVERPKSLGAAPTGGTRWEWDPIFLQSRPVGDPRNSEVDFRDSQIGTEIRRLF